MRPKQKGNPTEQKSNPFAPYLVSLSYEVMMWFLMVLAALPLHLCCLQPTWSLNRLAFLVMFSFLWQMFYISGIQNFLGFPLCPQLPSHRFTHYAVRGFLQGSWPHHTCLTSKPFLWIWVETFRALELLPFSCLQNQHHETARSASSSSSSQVPL
jgi:hypothetical protein